MLLNKKNVNKDHFSNLDFNAVLEVEIIDSGVGIDKEPQQYLYVPFLELKVKQDMKHVKNNSIGMGLCCSQVIMNNLTGSLELLESQRGRTVFQI